VQQIDFFPVKKLEKFNVQDNWFHLLYSSSRQDLPEWQQNYMATLSSEIEKLIIKLLCCLYFLLNIVVIISSLTVFLS
jgi:hypothetical protein